MLKSKKDEWSKYICKLTIMKVFFMSCDYIILILKKTQKYIDSLKNSLFFNKIYLGNCILLWKLKQCLKTSAMKKQFILRYNFYFHLWKWLSQWFHFREVSCHRSFVIIYFLHKHVKTTVPIFKKFQLYKNMIYITTPHPTPFHPPLNDVIESFCMEWAFK